MLEAIRAAEAQSHIEVYSAHRLFEPGSWLSKPVRTVMEIIPLFLDAAEFHCLDLGCGVGRNAIPIAQAFSQADSLIDCVDILPIAIEQLLENAAVYGVRTHIHGILSAIEDFQIPERTYDLILGVSALEHCSSRQTFLSVLDGIRKGIRPGGCVCLIINSGIRERDAETGAGLVPQFEVNFETAALQKLLEIQFSGWEILKNTTTHQCYTIPRGDRAVILDADVVTLVARK